MDSFVRNGILIIFLVALLSFLWFIIPVLRWWSNALRNYVMDMRRRSTNGASAPSSTITPQMSPATPAAQDPSSSSPPSPNHRPTANRDNDNGVAPQDDGAEDLPPDLVNTRMNVYDVTDDGDVQHLQDYDQPGRRIS